MQMREIKFRAWDRVEKRMMFTRFFERNWYATEKNDAEGCHTIRARMPVDAGCVEVMQFTGLQDKNGKEIYEGDIVKVFETAISKTDTQKQIRGADVVQSEYIGVIEWDNEGADYSCVSMGIEFGFPRHDQKVEVIGNIYENPELLK